jgi:ribosome biogenesis GTPase
MNLQNLGYTPTLETYRIENNLASFGVGRIILEHKERYVVKTETNEFEAEIIGNLRFSAQSRADFPAVGDWVAISEYDENKVLIHSVFPRKTIIERQSVGKFGEKQIIAANIDYAFIVQAVDRDFNVNRIERYLTICYTAKVEPIIVLSKVDLVGENELQELIKQVESRINNVQVLTISNRKSGWL